MNCDVVEQRSYGNIFATAGTYGIGGVEFGKDAVNHLVQFVGCTHIGIEIGGMVGGLVAVGVLTNAAGNVNLVAPSGLTAGVEERVEKSFGFVLATQLVYPTFYIVRHIGAVLPTVGLGEMVVDLGGVKGGDETTVASCVHKAVAVHDVLPRLGAMHISIVYLFEIVISGSGIGYLTARHLIEGVACNAPVIERVFKCFGYSFIIQLAVQIALCAVCLMGLSAVGGGNHSLKEFETVGCAPFVQQSPLLCHQYDGASMIANHAVGFVCGKFPHSQFATGFILA